MKDNQAGITVFLSLIQKRALFAFLIASLLVLGAQQITATPGDLDPSFNPGVITNGTASTLTRAIVLSDNKILITGNFTTIGGATVGRVARLNPNGSLDTTFNVGGAGADANVQRIVPTDNGKYFIVGFFANYNGVARNRIARINADGSLDTTFDTSGLVFNTTGSSAVTNIAAQTDGKFLICGFFATINGNTLNSLARLNADGSLDASYNQNLATAQLTAPALLRVGDYIYYGGGFTTFNGNARNRFVRLKAADGSEDTSYSFINGANNSVTSINLQPDGKIFVTGFFTAFGGDTRYAVARLNSDGSLDTTFVPAVMTPTSIYVANQQLDGKVLIGGNFQSINGVTRKYIARLNADGSLDTGFNPGFANQTVYVAQQLTDGKILVGGYFTAYNLLTTRTGLVKLQNSGTANGDYTGNTAATLAVYRPSNNTWFVNRSASTFSAAQFGLATDTLVTGDFDGDGKNDIAVFRANTTGQPTFYVLNSSNSTISYGSLGAAGDKPVVGDYDGDGKADFAVFRPSNGVWYILRSSNGSVLSLQFGLSDDIPVPSDYDGDGKTNLAVFRPSNGYWYYSRDYVSPSTNFAAIPWGSATDKLVPADYDGDGRTDLAVIRTNSDNSLTWYILQSETLTLRTAQFGLSTDTPVTGDFDGDNRDDVAVFRNGTWYILQSSAFGVTNNPPPAVIYGSFGTTGDIPLQSLYTR